VFAEEGFADAGSYFTEYIENPDLEGLENDREDTICATFRFEGVVDNGTRDGQLKRPMP
jgi:hypothetical protein